MYFSPNKGVFKSSLPKLQAMMEITMKKCTDIYKENMGESTFGASIYIDPLGYEYPKSVVVCHDCMFNFGHDSCVLYKEEGLDDSKIKDRLLHVQREKECQYFLIKNFSEVGDEDEKAREEVKEISKRLNYPKEYWRRSNIHKMMDEKGIGYVVFENKSCITCEYCENKYSSIGYCKFHNIELFLEDRYCENYQGNNINTAIQSIPQSSRQDKAKPTSHPLLG